MVDDKTMEKILYLSRLAVDEADRQEIASQMEKILNYFSILSKYDTSHVDVDLGETVPAGALRSDSPRPGLTVPQVKGFAVNFLDGYFSVPRILEEE